jgi:hypothetical protein
MARTTGSAGQMTPRTAEPATRNPSTGSAAHMQPPTSGPGSPQRPTDHPDPRGPFPTVNTPAPGVGPSLPGDNPAGDLPSVQDRNPSERPSIARPGSPFGD